LVLFLLFISYILFRFTSFGKSWFLAFICLIVGGFFAYIGFLDVMHTDRKTKQDLRGYRRNKYGYGGRR
jgi:hypothetical protein